MAKLAVGQIRSTSNIVQNLAQCTTLIQRASSLGAHALFLPEASDYIATSANESVALAKTPECAAFVTGIQEAARKFGIAVNIGVHKPAHTKESSDGGETKERLKNLSLWIDEKGEVKEVYQKIHLFDVDIGGGAPPLRESDSVEPGTKIVPAFNTPVGKVGLLICFDLRFPEPSLRLMESDPPASIITYPSAFTIPTGKVHWLPLLQARAIETQCYVVAAAQVGQHNEKRASYGHSTIIGPWGEVLVELSGEWSGEPELGICEVSDEAVEEARRKIPLKRRWDVYHKP